MTIAYWGFSHRTIIISQTIFFMQTTTRSQTLFVGVDVHKDTHTAVGISPLGEKIFEVTVGNYPKDFRSLSEKTLAAARRSLLSPYFGLEDCAGYGERLAFFLAGEGFPVVHVPPILVDHHRKRATHPEKSDSLDARGVAEVMIQKIDMLPTYTLTEEAQIAKQIKDISLDRDYLVKERTRLKNQLHTLLYRIHNSGYQSVFKNPFSKKALQHWMKSRPKNASSFLLRTMKRKVRRLIQIKEEVNELEAELADLIEKSGHTITTANGCGTVIAGELISEIGDIARFRSPGQLSKYAGCSPREYSSGKKQRHRKSRSGNRRLNRAFHRTALAQILKCCAKAPLHLLII